jgi:hypothetical protein
LNEAEQGYALGGVALCEELDRRITTLYEEA